MRATEVCAPSARTDVDAFSRSENDRWHRNIFFRSFRELTMHNGHEPLLKKQGVTRIDSGILFFKTKNAKDPKHENHAEKRTR